MKRDHLFRLMMSKELCRTKDEAVRWVLAGQVFVDGEPARNSGQKVPVEASIVVKGKDKRYASRGGYKLEGAIQDFSLFIEGKTALDAGASTGGFTDCLLKHGAGCVYAVDAGYGQLSGYLRSDPRVINMEKTNIGDLCAEELAPFPDFAAADLSYLSLKNAIPILRRLVAPGAAIVCLVKPLFETANSHARRDGRIRDDTEYGAILTDLVLFTANAGLIPRGVTHSHLRGSNGTIEFFLHIGNSDLSTHPAPHLEAEIKAAVEKGTSLPESPDSMG
jgi:23S rRNA (cytidine1920-2'-O)/16S rRNA (cytidine1409-2'-O)-methyltransferase